MGLTHSRAVREQRFVLPDELLLEGTKYLDIDNLVLVASINHRLRQIIKDVLKARIYSNLALFFPYNKITTFLTTLTDNRSVVGGSIAQAVITPSIFDKTFANNINIYIPAGTMWQWEKYLNDIGYIYSNRVNDSKATRKKTTFFSHDRGRAPNKIIIVIEAEGSSCLTALLDSPYTSQMNFFNNDHVYCMYPWLTKKLRTLQIFTKRLTKKETEDKRRMENRGLAILNTNEEVQLCSQDILCRNLIRIIGQAGTQKVTSSEEKIGIISWGNDKEIFLHSKRVQHWLGGCCENDNCPNRSSAELDS